MEPIIAHRRANRDDGCMASQKKTLYDILGVSRDANSIDLGLAHDQRRAELQRAAPQDPSALALLHEAFEVLSNPQRRAAYDAALVTASEKAAALEQAKEQEPDLVLDAPEDEAVRRKIPPVGIAAGVAVVLILVFLALHRSPAPPPPPEPVAAAPRPEPPPPPPPKSAKDILTRALASAGRLQGIEMSGRAVSVGLAIADEPGKMITTCHGIPAGAALVVTVAGQKHSATLTMTDELLDLCRISVPNLEGRPLALAAADPRPGDKIYALGANAAGEFALTEGTVKQLLPDARGKLVQLSMPVAPNGSGGAVFDAEGNVVAIATTAQGHGAGANVALPASWIAQMRSRVGH